MTTRPIRTRRKEENAAKGKATKAWKRHIRRVVDILHPVLHRGRLHHSRPESPAVEPSQDTRTLYVVDIFFTCAFTVETVMKYSATVWAHGHGYLADPFNVGSQ